MARTKKVEETPVVEEVKTEEVKAEPVKKTTKKAAPKKESAPKETKKASKKEEPKVLRTEAKASALSVKVTPRKARLVCDLVRGKDVDEALALLAVTHHKAAPMVAKVIKSAAANATNNFHMEGTLYVATIMASDSFKMKRYLPRAKGSASGLVKRFSNIYVTVRVRG